MRRRMQEPPTPAPIGWDARGDEEDQPRAERLTCDALVWDGRDRGAGHRARVRALNARRQARDAARATERSPTGTDATEATTAPRMA
jgi:hypothetical protein